MAYNAERAIALLRAGCGNSQARFRDGQEAAIRHLVEDPRRLLLVQRTGWGKSFVYFIATRLLREAGGGPALLVSPLLALMRNQLAAAQRMGVRAATINSDNQSGWQEVEAALESNEIDILLISPMRLANERFVERVLWAMASRTSLLIVDEAHCISDWGHDFMPHYRLLQRTIRQLPENMRVLATTATANNRVLADLESVLGPNMLAVRGELNRPSLKLQTIQLPDQAQRLAWLAQFLPHLPGSGIIYTLTVRDAEQVKAWLASRGMQVQSYTGQSEGRAELEDALLRNDVKALVATTALGMGFDKPDLGFVVHFQTPGSVVTYYQQVGRAGRALSGAYGILLSGAEDHDINEYFIENAFPTREEVAEILEALHGSEEGLSVPGILEAVNIRQGRVKQTINILSLESPAPLAKQGSKWQLTTTDLSDQFWERVDRLTALRLSELDQMRDYVALESGHMEFLIRALDGEPGSVQPNPLPALGSDIPDELVMEAVSFLRRTSIPLEPRKKWPDGGMPISAQSGNIPLSLRASEGLSLCVWGDAGWGELVRRGMYEALHLSDELVEACSQLIRTWSPVPAPGWVTCLPSTRHRGLVPDFAQRLATKLNLPFVEIIEKREDRPQQKTMVNSTQQARNVDGAFGLTATPSEQPVLLIDDLVNSGWTMTYAAWLLREGGAGPVYPFALATTGVR